MSSPRYDPGERQFVFATLGLIAALVVLGFVLIGVSEAGQGTPAESSGGPDPEAPAAGQEPQDSEGAEQNTTAAVPEDLTFLCDVGLELPEPTEIPADGEDAARAVAEEFARAAYGYTGDDAQGYESTLEERVVEECFWQSVAGEDVESMEEMVRAGGEQNAAGDQLVLADYVDFYIEEEKQISHSGKEYPMLTGVAVWVSRSARADVVSEDDLTGVQQRLTLARLAGSGGPQWKVVEGEVPGALTSEYERAADETAEEIVTGGG